VSLGTAFFYYFSYKKFGKEQNFKPATQSLATVHKPEKDESSSQNHTSSTKKCSQ